MRAIRIITLVTVFMALATSVTHAETSNVIDGQGPSAISAEDTGEFLPPVTQNVPVGDTDDDPIINTWNQSGHLRADLRRDETGNKYFTYSKKFLGFDLSLSRERFETIQARRLGYEAATIQFHLDGVLRTAVTDPLRQVDVLLNLFAK